MSPHLGISGWAFPVIFRAILWGMRICRPDGQPLGEALLAVAFATFLSVGFVMEFSVYSKWIGTFLLVVGVTGTFIINFRMRRRAREHGSHPA